MTCRRPFWVIATQNPLFQSGTYVLPESQLDRFLMRLSLGLSITFWQKKLLLQQGSRYALISALQHVFNEAGNFDHSAASDASLYCRCSAGLSTGSG